MNTAMAGLGAIIGGPFVTPFAQKIGFAKALIFFLLAFAFGLIGLYLVTDFAATFPLRLLFHAAITGIIILSEFWINSAAPPSRRGFFLGLYTTMLSLGFVAGPLILQTTGIHGALPFLIGAGVILLAILPVMAGIRQAPKLDAEVDVKWWKFIFLSPLPMMAVFVFGIAESGLLALFPVYGLRIGFTPIEVAGLLVALGLGNVLFQIPLGLLIDKASKTRLMVFFAVIGFTGAILLPYVATNTTLLYGVMFVWGGTIPGLYTLGLAQIGARYRGVDLAGANAAFIMIYSFGNLIGPPSIGVGMEIWNPHGTMWVIALAFGSLFIFTIRSLWRSSKN